MKKEKRASEVTLQKISALLVDLRLVEQLQEKRPGVFYLGKKELLHFHEVDTEIVADLFLPNERIRVPVTERSQQLDLLDRIWMHTEKAQNTANKQRSKKR